MPTKVSAKPLLAYALLIASTTQKKAVATQKFNAMDATGLFAVAAPAVASITKPKRVNGKSEIVGSHSQGLEVSMQG